jgi:hydroxysqualene synthase
MTGRADFASGKGHKDENFPVASFLVRSDPRAPILAFYRFARAADDVADHAAASADEKLAQLALMEAGIRGESAGDPHAMALRMVLDERGLTIEHALDLLVAFRRDVTQQRYASWAELMDYCRYSAAPVGRFVLDVHGEAPTLWPANDALCAALQVINHLQDCGKDYLALGRVYVPLDALAARELRVESLGERRASPALREVIAELAGRTSALLEQSQGFANQIADWRLATEVGVIQSLAESLVGRLKRFDSLSQRVHHRPVEMIGLALRGGLGVWARRLKGKASGKQPLLSGSRR